MGKIYSYLLKSFLKTLLRYFFILFFLISVIYFVKIAGFTSIMTLSFFDIFRIYFYYVPQLIMYIFPLTYFVALVVAIYEFSKDGEMIVLFSLGKSPQKVTTIFLIFALFISILLAINSIIFMPLSEQASHNFLKIKKVESKINLKDSEVGQRVGSWNLFTKKESDTKYIDLVLFSKQKDKEQIILAKSANFISGSTLINLILKDGKHFLVKKNEIIQTNFGQLKLSNALHKDELSNKGILEYWKEAKSNKKRAKWLCIYLLLSFFPFLTTLLAFSISIINPRIENRNIAIWIFLVIIIYFGTTVKISQSIPLTGSIIFGITFFIISILIYKKLIAIRY